MPTIAAHSATMCAARSFHSCPRCAHRNHPSSLRPLAVSEPHSPCRSPLWTDLIKPTSTEIESVASWFDARCYGLATFYCCWSSFCSYCVAKRGARGCHDNIGGPEIASHVPWICISCDDIAAHTNIGYGIHKICAKLLLMQFQFGKLACSGPLTGRL